MAYFKVLSQHLPGETEENNGKPQTRQIRTQDLTARSSNANQWSMKGVPGTCCNDAMNKCSSCLYEHNYDAIS
jgi:hypothetical protein